MAHYAFLDENNIVTEVIPGKDENDLLDGLAPEDWYSQFQGQRCIRTSYNGNIRKNYAQVGSLYDESRDAFVPPKPYPSWVLDEETCRWKAPKAYPQDNMIYAWNEEALDWETVPPTE